MMMGAVVMLRSRSCVVGCVVVLVVVGGGVYYDGGGDDATSDDFGSAVSLSLMLSGSTAMCLEL